MLRKKIIYTFLLMSMGPLGAVSQSTEPELNYRRSSLCMIMVESAQLPNSEKVAAAYAEYPFPDKYNNHEVGINSFNPSSYPITDAERISAGGKKSSAMGKAFAQAGAESLKSATGDVVDIDTLGKDVPLQIQKFIDDKQLAKMLVAKWFNRSEEGTFDYNLIKERGLYSASEEDKELASASASAEDYLFDTELIGNTFVVFNRLKFSPNEPVARIIRDQALAVASKLTSELLRASAVKAAEAVYEKTKEGYTVFTTTWLYQLHWNDTVAQKFNSYFLNGNIDRSAAWDTTTLFKLKLIGDETSSSIVMFSLKEKRTEDQIIKLSVNRNVDAVFAKLQKKYVVFRPVTPIASVGPVTARIGMKEGLEPGQTFEMLESRRDPKTGRFRYTAVGSLSVDKKQPIWDNRFKGPADVEALVEAALAGEQPNIKEEVAEGPEYTTFSGGKKAIQGMHFIRLKK